MATPSTQAWTFTHLPRFVQDGRAHYTVANPCNTPDALPPGPAACSGLHRPDTCTHTLIQDRLCNHTRALPLHEAASQQLNSVPAMRSVSPRSSTLARTFYDPRFPHLYAAHSLGPGEYSPLYIGLSPQAVSPSPDRLRPSAAMCAVGRETCSYLSPPRFAADRMYLDASWVPSPGRVLSIPRTGRNVDVRSWGHAGEELGLMGSSADCRATRESPPRAAARGLGDGPGYGPPLDEGVTSTEEERCTAAGAAEECAAAAAGGLEVGAAGVTAGAAAACLVPGQGAAQRQGGWARESERLRLVALPSSDDLRLRYSTCPSQLTATGALVGPGSYTPMAPRQGVPYTMTSKPLAARKGVAHGSGGGQSWGLRAGPTLDSRNCIKWPKRPVGGLLQLASDMGLKV